MIRTFTRALHRDPSPSRLIEFVALRGKANQLLWLWDRQQEDAVFEELLRLNTEGWAIYVGVNPRLTMAGGERSNIVDAAALVIDFDARATGGSFGLLLKEIERQRFPAPSIVVSSGNGNHAYWLLDKDYPAAAAETLGQRLCAFTASDDVWNISRIMRLPGTVNWKEPASWCVVDSLAGSTHRLAEIDHALTRAGIPEFVEDPLPLPPANPPADITMALARIPAGIRHLITTGDATGYPSNSEADWAVCCALVNEGCTDAQIGAVFASYPCGVLKVASSPPSYLQRTTTRARFEVARDQAARLAAASLPQPPFVEVTPNRWSIRMIEAYSVRRFWR